MKKYKISLDDEPKNRWREVIEDNKEEIKRIHRKMNIPENYAIKSIMNVAYYLGLMIHSEEIEYIANHCCIPFHQAVILQIMYELSACCTSCVFSMDDKLVHLRTMDWPLEELKKITIEVEFTKNNKTIYKAITWAGYVGILTAVKPNICSISLNYRRANGNILENIMNLCLGMWPGGYLIRYLMENEFKFDDIVKELKISRLVAPCYFIICGLENAYNVVRNSGDYDFFELKDNENIIQTNIDPHNHNENDNILLSLQRKITARNIISNLNSQNKNLSNEELLSNFYEYPIINDITIYICMMIPEDGYIDSSII
jgi:hypothetical protein